MCKKIRYVFCVVVCGIFLVCFFGMSAYAQMQFVAGIAESSLRRVVVDNQDSRRIVVAGENSVYISRDGGGEFKKILSFPDEIIADIFFDTQNPAIIYAAASRHLYEINGDTARAIYSCPDEAVILCAVRSGQELFVGTTMGLYRAVIGGASWRLQSGMPADTAVRCLAEIDNRLWCVADSGVYRFDDTDSIRRVKVLRSGSEEDQRIIGHILISVLHQPGYVWLGTTKGVYETKDAGKTWKQVSVSGLDTISVNTLVSAPQFEHVIYIGTEKGLLRYDAVARQAQDISAGLPAAEVRWLAMTPSGIVYAATAKGLFQLQESVQTASSYTLEQLLAHQPPIADIQQAALKYNDAHPQKMRNWRKRLKIRALLPEVSLDYDRTVTTALGASYDRVQTGPQDWGINLKWDVADLIWNKYEDDIDTRSRLNTQIRLDILDEINRLYFERLRMEHDIGRLVLAEEEMFQKKLRLQELTAMLDGYTGGYYSRRCKEMQYAS